MHRYKATCPTIYRHPKSIPRLFWCLTVCVDVWAYVVSREFLCASSFRYIITVIAWLVAFPLEEHCLLWGSIFTQCWIYAVTSPDVTLLYHTAESLPFVYFECVLQVQYLTDLWQAQIKHRKWGLETKAAILWIRFKPNMKTNTCSVRSEKRNRRHPTKRHVIRIPETGNVLENQFRFHPNRCV